MFTGFNELQNSIIGNGFSLLEVTETWLISNTSSNSVSIPGYTLFKKYGTWRLRGRGAGFYIKLNVSAKILDINIPTPTVEHLSLETKLRKFILTVIVIYRPPNQTATTCIEDLHVLAQVVHNMKILLV